MAPTDSSKKASLKRKQPSQGAAAASSSNGFKALGLSDEVYQGIVRMGFRVRIVDCLLSCTLRDR
jgi:hypothetical protein